MPRTKTGMTKVGSMLTKEYQRAQSELDSLERRAREAKKRIDRETTERKTELEGEQARIIAARHALGLDRARTQDGPVPASEAQ
jgi:hypothetical protein